MTLSIFRNRIKGHRKVKASELVVHPLNFRAHPDRQRQALQGIVAEVGFARSLLAYEDEEGRLVLIDGHLRRDMYPEDELDVEVLDLNAQEAATLLAVLDHVGTMANLEASHLDTLLAGLTVCNGALDILLGDLQKQAAAKEAASGEDIGRAEAEYPITPVFNECYEYVLIFCTNETDWAWLCTQLGIAPEQSYKSTSVAPGHVLTLERFKRLWESQ